MVNSIGTLTWRVRTSQAVRLQTLARAMRTQREVMRIIATCGTKRMMIYRRVSLKEIKRLAIGWPSIKWIGMSFLLLIFSHYSAAFAQVPKPLQKLSYTLASLVLSRWSGIACMDHQKKYFKMKKKFKPNLIERRKRERNSKATLMKKKTSMQLFKMKMTTKTWAHTISKGWGNMRFKKWDTTTQ